MLLDTCRHPIICSVLEATASVCVVTRRGILEHTPWPTPYWVSDFVLQKAKLQYLYLGRAERRDRLVEPMINIEAFRITNVTADISQLTLMTSFPRRTTLTSVYTKHGLRDFTSCKTPRRGIILQQKRANICDTFVGTVALVDVKEGCQDAR